MVAAYDDDDGFWYMARHATHTRGRVPTRVRYTQGRHGRHILHFLLVLLSIELLLSKSIGVEHRKGGGLQAEQVECRRA